MKAIILAAGEGTRLRPYTLDRPKCLVELGGRPLLEYQLESLETAGISDVTVVTGYRAEQVEAYGLPTRHNPEYATTNMVASLMAAADVLESGDDVLIAYSDIVYEADIVEGLCSCPQPLAASVDREWLRLWQLRAEDPLSDAETLLMDEAGDIIELGSKPRSYEQIQAQYMGLILARAETAVQLPSIYAGLDPQRLYDGKPKQGMFMTSFLQWLIDSGHPLRAVPVDGGWLEVDSVADLQRYEQLIARGQLDGFWCGPTVASRFGGVRGWN